MQEIALSCTHYVQDEIALSCTHYILDEIALSCKCTYRKWIRLSGIWTQATVLSQISDFNFNKCFVYERNGISKALNKRVSTGFSKSTKSELHVIKIISCLSCMLCYPSHVLPQTPHCAFNCFEWKYSWALYNWLYLIILVWLLCKISYAMS